MIKYTRHRVSERGPQPAACLRGDTVTPGSSGVALRQCTGPIMSPCLRPTGSVTEHAAYERIYWAHSMQPYQNYSYIVGINPLYIFPYLDEFS